ncbi:MAG: acyl-CoA synthetase [Microthrixaceae bacterium]|nr:acyl-CoA synthetase [Microthrixaceae bacterium]
MASMEFNLAQVFDALADALDDRVCIKTAKVTRTYAEMGERTSRFANALRARGLSVHAERSDLANHESGQDHVALYLHNCPEYLEGMIGSYKARAVPFNVNYRYVAEELEYLFRDSNAKAVVFHSRFAPTLADIRDRLPNLTVFFQVRDESENDLLEGAEWYEDALAEASPEIPEELRASWSPDDLYILYTGGTTGMPKGVLWRQADIFCAAMGGRPYGSADELESVDAVVKQALGGGITILPAPPFMHGAAHWTAFICFTQGGTIALQGVVDRLDAVDMLTSIEQLGVNTIVLVGDAFARPIIDEIERGDYDLSSLFVLTNGGAAMSVGVKSKLLELLPTAMIIDGIGSSETGQQAYQVSSAGSEIASGTFSPTPGACVINDTFDALISPDDDTVGWLGQRGRVPLGYLGDADKTSRTFPVIDGVRYSIPGDRAHYTLTGPIEVLGRDSVTINSGGEKIFAEEVEAALAPHADVFDVVVCGRPSERWGNEVTAIVQLREGAAADEASLLAEAQRHIARYKLPKAFVFVDKIERSPSGKADYRWAKGLAADDLNAS